MTNETQNQTEAIVKPANNYAIPVAIVVAGGLVAGAVFLANTASVVSPVTDSSRDEKPTQPVGSTDDIRPVTAEDHIKGNPDAPIKIVEYSDFECPFCKRFHDTMNQVLDEQGDSGDVAWIFRHFPLEQLHPRNAVAVALASECAAEQGGNDMFWKFSDRFMQLTPSNDRTDLTTILPQIYNEIGLDQAEIEVCIQSGKYIEHIKDDINDAIATGGRGTPWSVVIAPNGETFPLNGALPIEAVKQLISLASKEQ